MTEEAFSQALDHTREIEITTVGRSSGRPISLPVWFVRRDDKLYLLPVTGSDSDWYKNLKKTPTIRMAAGQANSTSPATPITSQDKVEKVVEAFRDKYGATDVKAYYTKTDVAVEVQPA
jgi:deazaflavin-dependent oxidoreductase (nitroreductase family)